MIFQRTFLALCVLGVTISQESGNQYTVETFDNSLSQSVSKSSDKNVILSPVSIVAAMGMVYLGANGETQKQIGQVLGLSPNTQLAKQELFQLQDVLKGEQSANITWSLANRILVKKGLQLVNQFELEVKNKYHASVDNFDFSNPQETANEVNSWVANKTNNVITKLLGPDAVPPETLMVLLNAVYFKGNWKYAFEKNMTMKECFYSSPGNCKMVDMMNQKRRFKYIESTDLQAQILELPYANPDYSMIIILPFQQSNLKTVSEKLKSTSLSKIIKNMQKVSVTVRIPKFEDELYMDLSSTLSELGANQVFSDSADLSNMIVGGGAKVSKVIHKAKISVTETGTVAAAATGISIMPVSLPSRPLIEKFFIANHPFLYKIQQKSQFLFSGLKIN